MPDLRHIVEESDTPAGRVFDLAIQALIVLSLVAFSLETLPDLSARQRHALAVFEWVSVGIFTVEYVLRVAVAKHKLAFIFSFYGLVDLLAILPTLLPVAFDLRSLRALRLIRLVRVLKLVRYGHAIDRFRRAFGSIRAELAVFFGVCVLAIYLASVGIYYFEREAQPEVFGSVFSSMWWAVVTLTTVGYGDVYPITVGGRVFTAFVLFVGLGVVAVPAGLMASALTTMVKHEPDDEH